MDPMTNPFSLLTFIAAPAILTNASSIMSLGTSNRFARVIDRARALAALLQGQTNDVDPQVQLWIQQLWVAERRAQLLLRALTSFYLSVGAFAAAALVSLLGAFFVAAHHSYLPSLFMWVSFAAGSVGVAGLVTGSATLVWETRLALFILRQETDYMRVHSPHNKFFKG